MLSRRSNNRLLHLNMSEIERFICFSSSFVRDFVKNIARKLTNRISYQVGMFRWGSKSAKGSISASVFGPGCPYPLAYLDRGVQIRCDTG